MSITADPYPTDGIIRSTGRHRPPAASRSFADPDTCGPGRDGEPPAADVIHVVLAVQMRLFRSALGMALSAEEDIHVAVELGRIDDMAPLATALRPHVAIIDIDLFADGALNAVSELNEALPDCAILVLADTDSLVAMRAALDAHVQGFVGKDCVLTQFVQYVRQVAGGERVIDPTLAVAALRAPRNPLSPRELDVLREAMSGAPSDEIAKRLHLSVGTVYNYMSEIKRKTNARNRFEAVRIAQDSGWL
jgi:two-component system response regulator DesR